MFHGSSTDERNSIEVARMLGRRGRSTCFSDFVRWRLLFFLLLAFSLIFNAGAAAAQEDEGALASISGMVESVDGPIGDLTVTLSRVSGENIQRVANTTTNHEGMYFFTNLTLGGNFILELRYREIYYLKPFIAENETVEANFELTGKVSVGVVDTRGSGVSGLELQLVNRWGYRVTNTTTDEGGIGGFNLLDLEEPFTVTFSNQGIPYSKVFRFQNGTSAQVFFKLLPATISDEEIEAFMHHMIVDVEGDYLIVWEGITYRNGGAEIFNNSWLKVWVPPEAVDFSIEVMDCCVQNTEEGVVFDPMEPIFPTGLHETSLAYKLKIKSSNYVLEKKLIYNTKTMYIFIRKTSEIRAENVASMTYEGERVLGGEEYIIFKGIDIQKGAVAGVRLKGLMSIFDILNRPLLWAVVLLVAPSGFFLFYLRSRRAGKVDTEGSIKVQPELSQPTVPERADRRWDEEIQDEADQALQVRGEIKPEEFDELLAEEKAIESVLEKIVSDYEGGQLSDGAYYALVSRYEGRLKRVRERLQSSNHAGANLEDA